MTLPLRHGFPGVLLHAHIPTYAHMRIHTSISDFSEFSGQELLPACIPPPRPQQYAPSQYSAMRPRICNALFSTDPVLVFIMCLYLQTQHPVPPSLAFHWPDLPS